MIAAFGAIATLLVCAVVAVELEGREPDEADYYDGADDDEYRFI